MTPIANHVEQSLSKLIKRWRGKPRFRHVVESYIRQVQDLEDAIWAVIVSRYLDTADITRLRLLGALVGQPQRGETDDEYRLYISARILVNRSGGRPNDVIRIAMLLSGSGVEYREHYPASFSITDPTTTTASSAKVRAIMIREAKSAGVGAAFIYGLRATDDMLLSCAGSSPLDSDTQGAALTDLSTGGYAASVL